MSADLVLLPLFGALVGAAASFSGLGGGFLMVPLLLFMGYSADRAVGTSFAAILVVSLSALAAHNKLAHVDWRAGILLGAGGIAGAQAGARLVSQVSLVGFRRILAAVLLCLAAYLFFRKG